MPKNYLRKIVMILLLMLCISSSRAQGNLPYVDDKFIHFGFSLGVNTMDFGVTSSRDSIDGKVYNAAISSLQPGFSVGIITDMRLSRYFNLRFTPTLHFGSRVLNYTADSTTFRSTTISSIPICLPIFIKYSAERKNNYRPYLIWGAGASIDLATDTSKPVLLRPLNFYTEFGAGCDIYFSFFKLSPELKFSLGLNNLLTPLADRIPSADGLSKDEKMFTNALSKLTSKMVTLTFNFE